MVQRTECGPPVDLSAALGPAPVFRSANSRQARHRLKVPSPFLIDALSNVVTTIPAPEPRPEGPRRFWIDAPLSLRRANPCRSGQNSETPKSSFLCAVTVGAATHSGKAGSISVQLEEDHQTTQLQEAGVMGGETEKLTLSLESRGHQKT